MKWLIQRINTIHDIFGMLEDFGYLEKDDEFAQQIVDLHNLIDNGHDIIEHVIQYETLNLGLSENEDIEKWISDRANCFINEAKCTYPLPPENHQAPLPSHNISVYTVF